MISKSIGRIFGSLIGAMASLLIAGCLNDPWLFTLSIASWLGLCTYISNHYQNNVSYAFALAGYTAAIIVFGTVNITDTQQIFDITQARVCEVITGILCGGLMMMILPSTSDGETLLVSLRRMHLRLLEHAAMLWQPEISLRMRTSHGGRYRPDPDHEPAANSGLLEPLPAASAKQYPQLHAAPAIAHHQRHLQPAPHVVKLARSSGESGGGVGAGVE
ncbi:p-hydroxybenzoic acid efflux pump subunit AaeB [Serratia fonticola]|uniref:p-hydroxybenzoic acid efflux pump subunit AaeB n=1 Tax=Serratia fonticola TaxID=47917 RepID=A0A4U9WHS7_SERFO|nr:p-hydroxybenzoic acid efflux pump subunit AaeB [Serratia fonticola]